MDPECFTRVEEAGMAGKNTTLNDLGRYSLFPTDEFHRVELFFFKKKTKRE